MQRGIGCCRYRRHFTILLGFLTACAVLWPNPAWSAGENGAAAPFLYGGGGVKVDLNESEDAVVIRIGTGSSSIDPRFRKVGSDAFVIELGGVTGHTPIPTLPSGSKLVSLVYSDNRKEKGVEISGSLAHPLDHFIVDRAENEFVVNLYLSRGSSDALGVAAEKAAASRTLPASAAIRTGSVKPAAAVQKTADKVQRPDNGGTQTTAAEPKILEFDVVRPMDEFPVQNLTGIQRKQYTGKPISLDLMDADLRNVLRLLADLTGTNIVIEPDVSGRVTLKVEQVPWDQVLDMVIAMNDLGKEQVGNVIRIARQTKLKQEWTQQTEAFKAKQDLMETRKDLGELTTVYLSVSYAQPRDIAARISEGKSDKGRVSVDERTSLIIYTDYPGRISSARQLLSRLDKPTSQVLIEARIVTLNTDVRRQLGVSLGFKSSSPLPSGARSSQDFEVNSPPLNLFGMSLAEVVGQTLLRVDLQLSALETANELRIMAAPRVLTMNNVKAVISQGVQIPYLKVGDTASGVTATEFKDAVLELQVTPHITPDRKIRMTLEAKQDEPSLTVVGAEGQPGIDTRKISTELLVDDGSIVVIGGVIRNRDSAQKSATPGLSDVPILGRLFKTEEAESQKTELLIFISPKIVEPGRPAGRV